MQSCVVWVTLAIAASCTLCVDSNIQKNYQLISGQTGKIFNSPVPFNGIFRSPLMGRFVEQKNHGDEPINDDEEDEDDYEEYNRRRPKPGQYGGRVQPGEEDDEDDDEYDSEIEAEEDSSEDEEEEEYDDSSLGRQIYISNQPYVYHQDNRRNVHTIRGSRGVSSDTRKSVQKNDNVTTERTKIPKKKKTNPANNKNRHSSTNPNDLNHRNRNTVYSVQQFNRKSEINQTRHDYGGIPFASSTQFIATPIADLILRLRISLAKPLEHVDKKVTSTSVPIHVQANVSEHEDNKVSHSTINHTYSETHKTDPIKEVELEKPVKNNYQEDYQQPQDLPILEVKK